MRVVFDTNVVVSATLWGGPPLEALKVIRAGYATLIASEEMINELKTVLARPKFTPRLTAIGRTFDALIEDYEQLVEMVTPAPIGNVVIADPKDDKFLACAVGGKAILVVSGDTHLLGLKKYQEVEIITI